MYSTICFSSPTVEEEGEIRWVGVKIKKRKLELAFVDRQAFRLHTESSFAQVSEGGPLERG